jgi:fermentation-respiration switch protein FrsA (DUF1100 family)
MRRRFLKVMAGAVVLSGVAASAAFGQGESSKDLTIRGKPLTLRTFGARGKTPVVVSSGDGGWINLAPHIAKTLASRGFFVVGFDSKEYLSKFTTDSGALSESDVPGDFRAVVEFAASGGSAPPILIGVSEGAGLSVLAATRPEVREKVQGVIAVGLPDVTELGWRWRDMAIYFTHKAPNEPTFNSAAVVGRVAPTPLAAIHSTRDEFVPVEKLKAIMDGAREPKRTWIIDAADHGFSDKRSEFDARLVEAIAWIASVMAGPR